MRYQSTGTRRRKSYIIFRQTGAISRKSRLDDVKKNRADTTIVNVHKHARTILMNKWLSNVHNSLLDWN